MRSPSQAPGGGRTLVAKELGIAESAINADLARGGEAG